MKDGDKTIFIAKYNTSVSEERDLSIKVTAVKITATDIFLFYYVQVKYISNYMKVCNMFISTFKR